MAKLKNVNTTDIQDAISLGCRTMSNVFNADDNDIPFFGSTVLPEARLSFSSGASESHVPGRHLNALLNAEDAVGLEIDERAIEKHKRAAFFSFRGPVPLPLNRQTLDGPLVNFHVHNVREGFHALYALVAYRHSEEARELAERSIDAILEFWDDETGWDIGTLEARYGLKVFDQMFVPGVGRAIGPLVKYFKATGYVPALHLAAVLKEKAIRDVFLEGGAYDGNVFGTHTHSTTCVMSSLAQLADLTHDAGLMVRVKAFYDRGLWDIRDLLGWVIEGNRTDASPDRGEVNNSGDIIETALILGKWGYTDYYQDAERIIRGHVLPSQLRDASFITDPPNPEREDGKHNVADRHLGAFGFPAPYGHAPKELDQVSFNMDIVGGVVGSLCEVYRNIVTSDETGYRVNLLFDHETPEVSVSSPYTHGQLSVYVRRPGPLWVRLPDWINAGEIRISGYDGEPDVVSGYLFFARPPQNREIRFDLPLKEQVVLLEHRTRSIKTLLRGDSVIAMDNPGAELTFFDPL